MLIERPLAELPRDRAEAFIRAVFAPDQRFARVCHQYFRALGHNEATAKLETRIELHRIARQMIETLGDPDILTFGFQRVAVSWEDAGGAAAYQPIALFSHAALTELGPLHVAILDAYADLDDVHGIALEPESRAA